MEIFKSKKILLGVTGSIAAYKAAQIARELMRMGAEVRVIMSPSACKFITPLTFESLTRKPVSVEMFPDSATHEGTWHIELAHWCDLMLIAPCSASTIAKIAHGICDTALATVAIALPENKPLIISPAMDYSMWQNKATQKNVKILESYGAFIIEPEEGELASGLSGPGRLPELSVIFDFLKNFFNDINFAFIQHRDDVKDDTSIKDALEMPVQSLQDRADKTKWEAEFALDKMKKESLGFEINEKFLAGKKVLISAGPTYEKIDDVRFIANYSSGKMGFALARIASLAGAEVVLVSGPVTLDTPDNVKRMDIESADEMYDLVCEEYAKCDYAVLAAAVADFTPINPFKGKIKKDVVGEKLVVELQTTNDILATLGSIKRQDQKLVGFALESSNEIENGWKKLRNKNCDIIVVNSVNKPQSGFQSDDNTITILTKFGREEVFPPMSKERCALTILKILAEL
ncbi:MAG: bifunctional phosphopantothenoylcysteine decarboxylase/phosphopantothenate synthase [Bacteroidota bacterium]